MGLIWQGAFDPAYFSLPGFQRVLVYGGRKFNDRSAVFNSLDALHKKRPIGLIVHGACSNRRDKVTGKLIWSADMLGQEWAIFREIPYCGWPAKWKTGRLGRGEGHARNQLMLDKTRPSLGVEFPGNEGTQDMRARLKKAGLCIAEFVFMDIDLE